MEPVTRQELKEELGQVEQRIEERMDTKLDALEKRMDTKLDALETGMDAKLTTLSDRLVEQMRDMQTELLRGFNAFAGANTARMDRLELSDMTIARRMNLVEGRLLQIETRLGIPEPPPPSA